MSIPRAVIQEAFPGQPRMQIAFETLVNDADDAVNRLNAALAAIGVLSGDAADVLAELTKRQPRSDLLTAISALPADPGVVEQTGAGLAAIRPIDAPDTKSLLTRQVADSRYLGSGTATTAPATATSAGKAGQIAYSTSFFYICVAPSTWRRVAIASW